MLDAATYRVTGEPVGMAHVTGYSSEDEVRLLRTSILVEDRFSNGAMSRSSSSSANAVIVNCSGRMSPHRMVMRTYSGLDPSVQRWVALRLSSHSGETYNCGMLGGISGIIPAAGIPYTVKYP